MFVIYDTVYKILCDIYVHLLVSLPYLIAQFKVLYYLKLDVLSLTVGL
jgi:hypothetical protein